VTKIFCYNHLLLKVEIIILDMSAVSGLDPSSAIKLHEIKEEYKDIGIIFIITGCSGMINN
jgi:ABC-type multidrug transport system ATPase subunit